jgi:CRISPR/Cas system-associated protein Cas7 (RAMP superfamily)
MMGNPDFQVFVGEQEEAYQQAQKDKDSERMAQVVREIINRLLTCAMDDVCGIMITAGVPTKRKSAIEFGWTVGLPGVTEVEEFIHARHAITRLTRVKAGRDDTPAAREQARREKEANIGQMVFNRPASSGVYAFGSPMPAPSASTMRPRLSVSPKSERSDCGRFAGACPDRPASQQH